MLNYSNLTVDDIDTWAEHDGNKGGIVISWSTDDIGFGKITIIKDKDDSIRIDSYTAKLMQEHMGKEFVKSVLDKLVDMTNITD